MGISDTYNSKYPESHAAGLQAVYAEGFADGQKSVQDLALQTSDAVLAAQEAIANMQAAQNDLIAAAVAEALATAAADAAAKK
jgi:flagellar biosynthesis/type III secretory pathway protein FliH